MDKNIFSKVSPISFKKRKGWSISQLESTCPFLSSRRDYFFLRRNFIREESVEKKGFDSRLCLYELSKQIKKLSPGLMRKHSFTSGNVIVDVVACTFLFYRDWLGVQCTMSTRSKSTWFTAKQRQRKKSPMHNLLVNNQPQLSIV